MATEPNRHDEAIEKVLAAIRDAAPPENMNARIMERLQHHQNSTAPGRVIPALTSTWWRGAASGAAFALLAISVVMLAQHALRTPSTHPQTAQSSLQPAITPSHSIAATATRSTPCARPTQFRLASGAPAPQIENAPSASNSLAETRADSIAPSRPAPVMPLTAQERELLRLAHTADPKQLAEEIAKVDEERAAEFALLSAHAAPMSSSRAHSDNDANSKVDPEANPETSTHPNPEANPEANQPTGVDQQPDSASNETNTSPAKEEQ